MRYSTKLLPSRSGNVGILSLNHLEQYNALTLDMVHSMYDTITEWYKYNHNHYNNRQIIQQLQQQQNDDNATSLPPITAIILKSVSPSPTITTKDDHHKKKKQPPKLFCAGGDVKQIYYAGLQLQQQQQQQIPTTFTTTTTSKDEQQQESLTSSFFRQEYQLNHLLASHNINYQQYLHPKNKNQQDQVSDDHSTTKNGSTSTTTTSTSSTTNFLVPQISFLDGIVMGGGVGISIHGQYRIITENTMFAMPETSIGFFPDVGTLFWFTHILKSSKPILMYLALTGQKLSNPIDLLQYTNIGTHYIPSNLLSQFEIDLIQQSKNNTSRTGSGSDHANNYVAPLLMSYHQTPATHLLSESFFYRHEDEINMIFQNALLDPNNPLTIEEIIERLRFLCEQQQQSSSSEFAKTTLHTLLHKVSPTSLKVTIRALYKSFYECTTLQDDLILEYRLSQAFVKYHGGRHSPRTSSDFYEGVRAILIDKDQQPKWVPKTIEEVTDEYVESFFLPLEHEFDLQPPTQQEQPFRNKL